MEGYNKLDATEKIELDDYLGSFDGVLIQAAHELALQEQALRKQLWDTHGVGFGPVYPYGWNPPAKGVESHGSAISINVDSWSMMVFIDRDSSPIYGDAYDRFWGTLRARNNEIGSRLRKARLTKHGSPSGAK